MAEDPELYLIDSSVFIHCLRQRLDPLEYLVRYGDTTDFASCPMVRFEVMRGVLVERVQSRLRSFFETLRWCPTDVRYWLEADGLAWQMDRTGRVLPAGDLLIAAAALRLNACVLTRDQHFSHIPGLRVRLAGD